MPEIKPCGFVYLTELEYNRQMNRPDSLWMCPLCGCEGFWSDGNYEEFLEEEENGTPAGNY